MPRFMLDHQVTQPTGYAERSSVLVKYRLPFLRHCFVLCHEPSPASQEPSPSMLMAFFLSEAERLANESVGDPQAFVLIHSGSTVRKRMNWHLHIFVVQHRWQKALVYLTVCIKSAALAAYYGIRKICGLSN